MKRILVFTIIVFTASVASAYITNVSISPTSPNTNDQISIMVSGVEGKGDVQITNTDFLANGNSLLLDIYIDLGATGVSTPWWYSEAIGTLSAGTYDLTVRRFLPSYYPPPIIDTYETVNFTVTPELCTLVLLGLGLPFLRRFSKRKI